MPAVAELVSFLDSYFPSFWAEPWDNTGLTVGRLDGTVTRVLISLDVTAATVGEAEERGCQMLLTHHPFPWRERRRFDLGQPEPQLLRAILERDLFLLAVHTNLDAAPRGHAAWLADRLGLREIKPLRPSRDGLVKTVFFAPVAEAGRIRSAIASAGAGAIGAYSACTFSSSGTGRFTPGPQAKPAMGRPGHQSELAEERIEAVCPAALWPKVVEAVRAVHPYETMAFDVFPEVCGGTGVGLGRLGLIERTSIAAIIRRLQDLIPLARLQVAGDTESRVEKVALCPGAAGDLLEDALTAGAELMLGAEFTHHHARTALAHGLTLLDPGHYATERPALDILARLCRDRFGDDLEVIISTTDDDPFRPG